MRSHSSSLQPLTPHTATLLMAHTHEIADGALVSKRNTASGYASTWHRHDCSMLLLPVAGRLRSSDETSQDVLVRPGVFVWVPEGFTHQTVAQSSAQTHIALYIDTDFFNAALRAVNVKPGAGLAGVRIASPSMTHFTAVLNGFLSRGVHHDAAMACAGALLHESARQISRQGGLQGTDRLERLATVEHAREILLSRLQEPLRVDLLAQELKLSARQLQRIFKAETGMTLDACLAQERIAQARHLLESTQLSIIDVGNTVGWSNPSYFSRCFREHTGSAPGEFRQLHRAAAV
jgi:AraC-like DNA-binding protein/mannose-6-phosphate isomerase-like protein (cupin superfamily)